MFRYSLLWLLIFSTNIYAKDRDVYGRNMTYTSTSYFSYLNKFGHLGIEKGGVIYNMVPSISSNKTLLGQDNYLHLTKIKTFKNASNKFYGVKYDSPRSKDYLTNRYLDYVRLIGADYSFYINETRNPSVSYNRRTKRYSFHKGILRCDTMVLLSLKSGGKKYNGFTAPIPIFNSMKNYR